MFSNIIIIMLLMLCYYTILIYFLNALQNGFLNNLNAIRFEECTKMVMIQIFAEFSKCIHQKDFSPV
jgi:hypothetical protein